MGKVYHWIDRVWQWVAERVFVRFDFDIPLEKLQASTTERVVFTLTSVGIIEFLILSSWCRKNGLPGISVANRRRILFLAKPKLFFQIVLRRKSYADLFVSDEAGPRLLFCPPHERTRVEEPVPVEMLLRELYTKCPERNFTFYPAIVLWRKHVRGASRNPTEYFLGLSSDPNLLGKFWYLVRRRKDSLVKCLDSFPMSSTVEGSEGQNESEPALFARQLRRRIIVETQKEMRVMLGPRYLSPHSVKETILRDPEIQKVIDEVATKEGVDRKKIMSRAYSDLTEIVSNYRYRTIEILYVFLKWLFTKVFDGVSAEEADFQRLREEMKTKAVVFVSCHRSHLDYLVIPYVLFEHDTVTPHIAAGINLAFWPFGPLARSGGAFFIRRSFRGDAVYSACLRKYVEYLLKNRYNVKFFIEGTRSRSGKMLPPAYGLLKMVLEAERGRGLDDVALVPVSITYDEVPEERAYTREIAGEQKTQESAKALFKSREIIKRNFGKVYVRFGDIISTKDARLKAEEAGQTPTLALQKTAFQLCKNINDATPVTAKSIVASVFLGHTEESLSLEEILHHAQGMSDFVLATGHKLSVPDAPAFRRSVEQTVRRLQKSGMFQLTESAVPRRYSCDRRRRTLLAFYKNNAIHLFITPSITVNAFLRVCVKGGLDRKVASAFDEIAHEALELRNWLKFDFFFNPTVEFNKEVKAAFDYFFCEVGDVTLEECLKRSSLEKLPKADDFLVYSRLIEDLLESYITAGRFCLEHPGQKFDRRALTQRMLKFGEVLLQKREIILPESLSVQNYSNAVLLLENLKALEVTEGDKKTFTPRPDDAETKKLVSACESYLQMMREEAPELLKRHRSPVFPELHFSP